MNLRSRELLKTLSDEIPDNFPLDTYTLTVLVNRIYLNVPYTGGHDLDVRSKIFVRIVSDLSNDEDSWRFVSVDVGLNDKAFRDDYSILVKWYTQEGGATPLHQIHFSLRECEAGLIYGYVDPNNENWREETLACLDKIQRN